MDPTQRSRCVGREEANFARAPASCVGLGPVYQQCCMVHRYAPHCSGLSGFRSHRRAVRPRVDKDCERVRMWSPDMVTRYALSAVSKGNGGASCYFAAASRTSSRHKLRMSCGHALSLAGFLVWLSAVDPAAVILRPVFALAIIRSVPAGGGIPTPPHQPHGG